MNNKNIESRLVTMEDAPVVCNLEAIRIAESGQDLVNGQVEDIWSDRFSNETNKIYVVQTVGGRAVAYAMFAKDDRDSEVYIVPNYRGPSIENVIDDLKETVGKCFESQNAEVVNLLWHDVLQMANVAV